MLWWKIGTGLILISLFISEIYLWTKSRYNHYYEAWVSPLPFIMLAFISMFLAPSAFIVCGIVTFIFTVASIMTSD